MMMGQLFILAQVEGIIEKLPCDRMAEIFIGLLTKSRLRYSCSYRSIASVSSSVC